MRTFMLSMIRKRMNIIIEIQELSKSFYDGKDKK